MRLPRIARTIAIAAAAGLLALAPTAGALGPTSPRAADDPGTFRLLVPADRAGSAWGNRWVGLADELLSWLGAAFRVDPAKLVAPPPRVPLRKRSGPQ
jgi:hypothetical protein